MTGRCLQINTAKVLLTDLTDTIRGLNGSKTWRYLVTHKNVLRAIENLGIETSFGFQMLATGVYENNDFARFIECHNLVEEYLIQVKCTNLIYLV